MLLLLPIYKDAGKLYVLLAFTGALELELDVDVDVGLEPVLLVARTMIAFSNITF